MSEMSDRERMAMIISRVIMMQKARSRAEMAEWLSQNSESSFAAVRQDQHERTKAAVETAFRDAEYGPAELYRIRRVTLADTEPKP